MTRQLSVHPAARLKTLISLEASFNKSTFMLDDPTFVGSSGNTLENIDIARGIFQKINIHAE